MQHTEDAYNIFARRICQEIRRPGDRKFSRTLNPAQSSPMREGRQRVRCAPETVNEPFGSGRVV